LNSTIFSFAFIS